MKTGYTWTSWSGTFNSNTVTRDISLKANTYYILFYLNYGSGTMETLTCKYDMMTYTLPVMSFIPPDYPNTYLGWNTDLMHFQLVLQKNRKLRILQV